MDLYGVLVYRVGNSHQPKGDRFLFDADGTGTGHASDGVVDAIQVLTEGGKQIGRYIILATPIPTLAGDQVTLTIGNFDHYIRNGWIEEPVTDEEYTDARTRLENLAKKLKRASYVDDERAYDLLDDEVWAGIQEVMNERVANSAIWHDWVTKRTRRRTCETVETGDYL